MLDIEGACLVLTVRAKKFASVEVKRDLIMHTGTQKIVKILLKIINSGSPCRRLRRMYDDVGTDTKPCDIAHPSGLS